MKPPLVILTGPTAVGKTALSLRLAKRLHGEIVSADSVQVYRGRDIGSAKIQEEEREGIPHHLLDVLDPKEPFHVVRFQALAREALAGIYRRGHIPLLTGGTGFYIQALLYGIQFGEEGEDGAYRLALEEMAVREGPIFLHERLRQVDPASAESIHPHNVKRVIRALEYYHLTRQPISAHNARERERSSPYRFCYFVLTDRREEIYRRIDQRVDEMLEAGLVEEVRRLAEEGCRASMVSMQALGYKEILAYLEGSCSLEEAVRLIKRNTRHFAKRQLTWFRREKEVIWVDKEAFQYREEDMVTFMVESCRKRGLLEGDRDGSL